MARMSKIEWTNETWNPTTGCDRISPGCGLPIRGRDDQPHGTCYALTMAKRLQAMGNPSYTTDGDPTTSGPGFGVAMHERMLDAPKHFAKPSMVFVDSMSDLFHPEITDEFIDSVWDVMAACPQHTFQILTKRPQRMREWVLHRAGRMVGADLRPTDQFANVDGVLTALEPGASRLATKLALPNVWLGVSIESDAYTWRANYLRDTPAAVRFISAEPLLGPLPSLDLDRIDWLIVGGESGPGARPMHPRWARDLRDACLYRPEPCEIPDVPKPHSVGVPGGGRACACEYTAPVAFFYKQHGAWRPIAPKSARQYSHVGHVNPDGSWYEAGRPGPYQPGAQMVARVGKGKAGRDLDGRTWDEYPPTRETSSA